jgi:hypothetical protein
MITFESTQLWKSTLAARTEPDQFHQERERLRAALLSFRDRAGMLAGEISRDLPDYTVHDISHLDALWQMADLIVGSEYEITPTEAFVLGGTFLIHDLGNGLAAYPDGINAMYVSAPWRDAVSLILRKKLGRAPTLQEIDRADDSTRRDATGRVLRALHAQQADRLALVSLDRSGFRRRQILDRRCVSERHLRPHDRPHSSQSLVGDRSIEVGV